MIRVLYIFTALLLVSNSALSVPSCVTVVKDLTPCLGYLKGNEPTPLCCAGVKDLKGIMKTKEDKVAVCKCSKDVLKSFTYNPILIPALPTKCGTNLVLPPIDKNFDCNKVALEP